MYPISRLLTSSLKASLARKRSPLGATEVGELIFYTRPWDLDMFMEMNNGRVLTLYDLGRFDWSIRTGFWEKLLQNKWGLAVAGSSVRYRRRVRLLDKVTMRTVPAGRDERWFYIAQSMWVKGEPTSSVVLRTCVTAKGRSIPTDEVWAAMGNWNGVSDIPQWVQNWDEADKTRPWPPHP